MDLAQRANILNVREVRGLVLADPLSPTGMIGADWSSTVSVRVDSEDPDFWQFHGLASVVDVPYTVRDMFGEFTETIRQGAFDVTLGQNPDVMLNYMHDPMSTMVTTRSTLGALTLTASPHLEVNAKVPKKYPTSQIVMPMVAGGDATSMSFAFRVTHQSWNEDYTERDILGVNLHRGDVAAIVTGLGANPAAYGTVRSADSRATDALLAMRAGSASPEQVAQLAEIVSNSIDMADDAFDAFLAALGIPDPDAGEDVTEQDSALMWDDEQRAKYLARRGELSLT